MSMIKELVAVGFILMFVGLAVTMMVPVSYTQTVMIENTTASVGVVEDGQPNLYGLWIAMLGLAFIFLGTVVELKTQQQS